MNDYVINHNFDSWESDKTIKKLKIRNINDLRTYLDLLLLDIFDGKISNNSIVLSNGESYTIDIAVNE